jgi:AcrR family transcriptional regulator
MPCVPRTKQRTPELGKQVLEAALRILGREGVRALTARGLAAEAGTSPAAVYELFGDMAGVEHAVAAAGFARLAAALDAAGDIPAIARAYRGFVVGHPALATVMFRGPHDSPAGAAVRERIVTAVRDARDAGALAGDPTDVAHAFVALIHGLAAAESSRRLGTSAASVDRRWRVAVGALLAGFAPPGPGSPDELRG